MKPKTRGPERDSRSALIVVAYVFSWTPVRLRHVRGGVGRRRSLNISPSGRLLALLKKRNLHCKSCAGMLVRQSRCSSSVVGAQSLRLVCRMRRVSLSSNGQPACSGWQPVQTTLHTRRAESIAPLPGRPCPSYATIFHTGTIDRVRRENARCSDRLRCK